MDFQGSLDFFLIAGAVLTQGVDGLLLFLVVRLGVTLARLQRVLQMFDLLNMGLPLFFQLLLQLTIFFR